AIDPSCGRPVGGTETRAWTFARGLAETEGCDVSIVVRSEKTRPSFRQEGVEVIPRRDRLYSLYESVGRCIERSPRFPGVRLRRWEWPLLWRVPMLAACRLWEPPRRDNWRPDAFYQQLPADVYCTFGVQANSARVIASAHAAGRPAILMIGSDGDLDERYRPGSNYISQYGDVATVCYQILQQADAIVAQTTQQQQWIADRFGRDSTVIRNPMDLATWDHGRTQPVPDEIIGGLERYALWVGRAESLHKRPELLLQVASLCPAVRFLMILNPRDRWVEQFVRDQCPPNVRIVPFVPFDLMPAVFERATVFISTSALEGFPNVFLQAAASRVPIASLEVGGDFITAAECGFFACGDLRQLARYVQSEWDRGAGQERTSEAGRAYVAAEHGLEAQSGRLLELARAVSGLERNQEDSRTDG
ncbi:MAG: glycosyltransferase family 4 protein, partial [Planctomycetaceae bacterium]|nr:glycosyltransferase family 4 protein [Planctomycetaceae bacterium]